MDKNSIKNFAIWARNELITKVTQKAFEYGISVGNTIDINSDSINGRLLSSEEKNLRQKLILEVKTKGFEQVMEEVAYTWFNRFIALRYMEVNNYLPNRVRLFTNESNEFKPQILDECAHVELDGLDKEKVYDLLEKNENEELYKLLLLATCNDMHKYLPGMFETINDYKVLLFPENLLRSESVLGRMISDIDEGSWSDQIEIIGWMYQFYIQNPKDRLIHAKKQYKKNDIQFVTQLFTPDWIVKYMVDNSLGKFWHDTNPDETITSELTYFIRNEVKAKEKQIIRDVESIKFLDPCMGSGHVLVYAFEVLMRIYEEQGWTQKDAAISIIKNNLYGLDIDDRAYQLAYFAVMMKARSYNRQILKKEIVPNIFSIKESNAYDIDIFSLLSKSRKVGLRLHSLYENAKEYGSIIDVDISKEELNMLVNEVADLERKDMDLMQRLQYEELKEELGYLIPQTNVMNQKYDVVVTNPPYLNSSLMPSLLKNRITNEYSNYKSDLFAVFIVKCINISSRGGYIGMLTPYVWMFINSYEKLREYVLSNTCIDSLVQLEYNAFEAACVPVASFVLKNTDVLYAGNYVKLSDFRGAENQGPKYLQAKLDLNCEYRYSTLQDNFTNIPGSPIAYWVSDNIYRSFNNKPLGEYLTTREGMATADNNRFLRLWHEVIVSKIEFNATKGSHVSESKYWIPYNKGGEFRKWYGNNDYVVNWKNDGYDIKHNIDERTGRIRSHNYNGEFSFCEGGTWSALSSGNISVRYSKDGFLFDSKGAKGFAKDKKELLYSIALINSKVGLKYLSFLSPTIDFKVGDIIQIPTIIKEIDVISKIVQENINLSKKDWDSFETSWDFLEHPLVKRGCSTVNEAFELWNIECNDRYGALKANEERLNKYFIDIYGLQDELDPNVEDKDITVSKADLTRDIKSLISYAVGCMFGRYSLKVKGLAYAGGEWNNNSYELFLPDTDNIIPICDDEYFEDDIVGRFVEFVKAAYGVETLEENLKFISSVLGGKGTSREIIRNYFINDFFKDHCATYQVTGSGKRPIYWLFDSGKKNGFKALIYIHRYTPDLIARMRTKYIHEQQSRYRNQIEMLEKQVESDISASERVRQNKQLKKFKEQDEELRAYEEKIHHCADKMESINLDDGVKDNYAKFQELLAKIK